MRTSWARATTAGWRWRKPTLSKPWNAARNRPPPNERLRRALQPRRPGRVPTPEEARDPVRARRGSAGGPGHLVGPRQHRETPSGLPNSGTPPHSNHQPLCSPGRLRKHRKSSFIFHDAQYEISIMSHRFSCSRSAAHCMHNGCHLTLTLDFFYPSSDYRIRAAASHSYARPSGRIDGPANTGSGRLSRSNCSGSCQDYRSGFY